MTTDHDPRLASAYRTILSLAGTCVGLLAVVAYLLVQRTNDPPQSAALLDPDIRLEVIAQLVAENRGIFDSHPDADVGRVQQPSLSDRKLGSILVSTNRYGMRERDYVLPKPDDVVRVVLLGDSMIFAFGAAAEDRLGAQLETWLQERSDGFEGRIECLHLGTPSWNIQAEAAYLRRQLYELDPDLVIQVVVPNDLDDSYGVRGFGNRSKFSPQVRDRADSLIGDAFPVRSLGFSKPGYLRFGIDGEGRARYRAAVAELQRLAQAVTTAGGHYRLIVNYRAILPVAWNHLTRHLEPESVVYLSKRFSADRSYTIAKNDPHWNRDGHSLVAKLLYGLITRDDLLPRLNLPVWQEASEILEEIDSAGRNEAERELDDLEIMALYRNPQIASRIDFTKLENRTAAQIHGGVDNQGHVSPYASLLLRNDGGQRLVIDGNTFPHPVLSGSRVRIFVDTDPVGDFDIEPGSELSLSYPLPAAAAAHPFVSVRFEATDYIYQGPDLQHCVVFTLHSVAIES